MNQININDIKSKTNPSNPILWLFNLGVKSGLPKYVVFFGLLQTSLLLIPESIWGLLGLNIADFIHNCPYFVQHYVNMTSFKCPMFMFWLMSPFTLFITTVLCLMHINIKGYSAYLIRRESRLKRSGKTSDYSSPSGFLAIVLLYLWGTGINLNEPGIFASFSPA